MPDAFTDDLIERLRGKCNCLAYQQSVDQIAILRKSLRDRPGNAVDLMFAESATRDLAAAVRAFDAPLEAGDAAAVVRAAREAQAVLSRLAREDAARTAKKDSANV